MGVWLVSLEPGNDTGSRDCSHLLATFAKYDPFIGKRTKVRQKVNLTRVQHDKRGNCQCVMACLWCAHHWLDAHTMEGETMRLESIDG